SRHDPGARSLGRPGTARRWCASSGAAARTRERCELVRLDRLSRTAAGRPDREPACRTHPRRLAMTASFLLKGALVEYGAGLGAHIPNIVIFQFNPDTITRTIEIPPKPTGAALREANQAGDIPVERISLTAQFTTHEPVTRLKPLSL